MAKKTISCRVCGKQFEPCAYCQKNGDIFRWRNFACSLECAKKYVADAVAYRNKNSEIKEEVQQISDDIYSTVEKESVIEEAIVNENTADELSTVVKDFLVTENYKKTKKKNYKN